LLTKIILSDRLKVYYNNMDLFI